MDSRQDSEKVVRSDEEWRAHLDPDAYAVLRGSATEPPFTGEYVDTLAGKGTFEEYAERWLAAKITAARKPSTIEPWRSHLRTHLKPAFGKVELRKLTREAVKAWAAGGEHQWVGESYREAAAVNHLHQRRRFHRAGIAPELQDALVVNAQGAGGCAHGQILSVPECTPARQGVAQ